MKEIKFDAGRFAALVQAQVVPIVAKATDALHADAKFFSPVDTGAYKAGHRNLGVVTQGNLVIGTVENEMEYAERVEDGFRKTPVNWHIDDRRQIYVSKGADVYKKSLAKASETLMQDL